jgi:hypothetical protein
MRYSQVAQNRFFNAIAIAINLNTGVLLRNVNQFVRFTRKMCSTATKVFSLTKWQICASEVTLWANFTGTKPSELDHEWWN